MPAGRDDADAAHDLGPVRRRTPDRLVTARGRPGPDRERGDDRDDREERAAPAYCGSPNCMMPWSSRTQKPSSFCTHLARVMWLNVKKPVMIGS